MNSQRKSIKRRRNLATVIVLIIVSIITGALLRGIFTIKSKHEIPVRPPVSTDSDNANLSGSTEILTCQQLSELNNNRLLLVNSDYKVPDDLQGGYANVSDYVRTLNDNILLNKDALMMLKEMFGYAADVMEYDEFRVTEGYRTFEYQQSLYDTAADKSLVALPGYSEHQTGLAVDISYNGVNIGNSRQGNWLMDNAYKFGFILRYPANKTDITKIPYEPWHYRYIGQPHAYYCYQNDLALEEYIDYLRTNKETAIEINGTEYKVYYLSDENEEIEIPQYYSHSVSGDNVNGLIVTVWID